MNEPTTNNLQQHQQGAALLVLMFILVMGASMVTFDFLRPRNNQLADLVTSTAVLAEAKEALTSYTTLTASRLGTFPCPDLDDDGNENLTGSDCTHWIGWLPHNNLGISRLTDGAGQRLWYALSANFQSGADPATHPINSDTPATLTVDGNSNVVAVVIAPGKAILGQNRSHISNLTADTSPVVRTAAEKVTEFLEGDNQYEKVDGSGVMTNFNFARSGAAPNTFNDIITTVSLSEFMPNIENTILEKTVNCLNSYAASANGKYPWADQLGSSALPNYSANCGSTFGRLAETLITDIAQTSGPEPVCTDTDADGDFADQVTGYESHLNGTGSTCNSALSSWGSGDSNSPTCRQTLTNLADCRKILPTSTYTYSNTCDLGSTAHDPITVGGIDYTTLDALSLDLLVYSPQPASGCNIIANGHFDTDTSSWTPYNATIASKNGGQTNKSLRITNGAGFSEVASQQFTLESEKSYQISFYFKADNSDSGQLTVGDGINTPIYDSDVLTDSEWTHHRAIILSPVSGTSLYSIFLVVNQADGSANNQTSFDQISLVDTSTTAVECKTALTVYELCQNFCPATANADSNLTTSWPAVCFIDSSHAQYDSWRDWRELLFYQAARGYMAGGGGTTPGTGNMAACSIFGVDSCLDLCSEYDGNGICVTKTSGYQALVILGKQEQTGQDRDTAPNNPASFLEGGNVQAIVAPDYELGNAASPSGTDFNDSVSCIPDNPACNN